MLPHQLVNALVVCFDEWLEAGLEGLLLGVQHLFKCHLLSDQRVADNCIDVYDMWNKYTSLYLLVCGNCDFLPTHVEIHSLSCYSHSLCRAFVELVWAPLFSLAVVWGVLWLRHSNTDVASIPSYPYFAIHICMHSRTRARKNPQYIYTQAHSRMWLTVGFIFTKNSSAL